MDVNNDADGGISGINGISGDINLVSDSIIDDGASEEQGVAMPTVSTSKKAKKAAVGDPCRLVNTRIKSNSLCRRKPPHVQRRPRRRRCSQRSHQALQAL